MKHENVILVDFVPSEDWAFLKEIQLETKRPWRVKSLRLNVFHGSKIKNACRCLGYFWFAFCVFIEKRRYQNVIAWQQYFGVAFAFYCDIFKVKKAPNVTIMTFIYKPKSGGLGQLHQKIVSRSLNAECVKNIIVFSDNEPAYYSDLLQVNINKFHATTLGLADSYQCIATQQVDEDVILSAGRSNRDYPFLVDAIKNEGYKLKIICDEYQGVVDANVTCLAHCHGEDYLRELSKCWCVAISLADKNISAGQLVILNAMMMGKPVIVTNTEGVAGYIQSGKNGFVIEKNKQELLSVLNQLKNKDIYNKVALCARETFVNSFTEQIMARNIAAYMKEAANW